ncbi:FRG domain-containing protein [Pediococcus pentosaceus]|uniref:FRG domain-containing protein n=1 Tax=Pediococcus pentosaceus TaxID=1255 RepID=UPI0039824F8C
MVDTSEKCVDLDDVRCPTDVNLGTISRLMETITIVVPYAASQGSGNNFEPLFGDFILSGDGKNKLLENKIRKIVDEINNYLKNGTDFKRTWAPFYLLKEISQKIKENCLGEDEKCYYRGQSNNWELLPGTMRSNVNEKYRDAFENEYHQMGLDYEEITYQPLSKNSGNEVIDRKEIRVRNIAKLQHFGMATPFVDITLNPFVAMYFMLSGKNKNSGFEELRPEFDIFICSNKVDNGTLVDMAPHTADNVRLNAQKGAFLNFEKPITHKEMQPLTRIKIEFQFSLPIMIRLLNDEVEAQQTNKEIKENLKVISEYFNQFGDEDMSVSDMVSYFNESEKKNIQKQIKSLTMAKASSSDMSSIAHLRDWLEEVTNLEEKGRGLIQARDFLELQVVKTLNKFNEKLRIKLNEYQVNDLTMFPDLPKHAEYVARKYPPKRNQSNKTKSFDLGVVDKVEN